MKKTAIILGVIFLVSIMGYAQHGDELKGPAAKNYKPWKDKSITTQIVYTKKVKTNRLMGPDAKNYKHWNAKNDGYSPQNRIKLDNTRPRRMGPTAKNHKPWMD